MQQPPDSKITITVGECGEDVVVIPPSGMQLVPLLAMSLFVLIFLTAWIAGVWLALRKVVNVSEPLGGRLFAAAWLAIWVLGGPWAWSMLVRTLMPMFREEQLALDYDQVVHRLSLFGWRRTRSYPIGRIVQFEYPYPYAARAPFGPCTMLVGKRRIPIGRGLTDLEAEWLAQELNALLERRR